MPRGPIPLVLTIIVVTLAAAACGGDDDAGAETTASRGGPIEGRWELTRYAGASGALTAPAPGVTADATFAGGRLRGRAPVNTYTAAYTAGEDGSLEIGDVARTLMAGTPAQDAAEERYFAALDGVAAYRSDGTTLRLYGASGAEVLVYARDEAGIAGTWTVTGYNNGRSAVVSPEPGSTLTARFADDGSLTGDAGVNRYTGTFTTGAPTGGAGPVTVGPIATTRRAGPPALMEQETRFLAALESAETFTLQGPALTLRNGEDAIAVTLSRSTPR